MTPNPSTRIHGDATSRQLSCRLSRRAALAASISAAGLALVVNGSTPASAASSSSESALPPPVASSAHTWPATAVPLGSIVYVRSNNIWIMRGDGSGKRQLTKNGTAALPYRSPSQSDSGRSPPRGATSSSG